VLCRTTSLVASSGPRVTLTFHFRSGAQITYHVTRAGSTVTGTTS
jgi:hypothetical protein